ncbi:MAG: hypothetical protein V2B19_21710 [Pseudomonadota bacterium]
MKKAEIVLLILAPFLGVLAFLTPILVARFGKIPSVNLIVIIGLINENIIFLPTAMLLFIIGIFLGYYGDRIWWLTSMLTIIILPINAILEMRVMPKSHNLWPFEFVIYQIMALPAVIGSYYGKIRRERRKREQTREKAGYPT